MAGKTYDIFISNRRTASESAQLISSSLKDRGYDVFLDVESLRSGKFNEQLYVSLTHAKISCWCFPMERLNDAPTRGTGSAGRSAESSRGKRASSQSCFPASHGPRQCPKGWSPSKTTKASLLLLANTSTWP